MRVSLAAAFVALISASYAWKTTTTITSSPSVTGQTYTCPLITETKRGGACPTPPPSNCTIAECISLVLVTQPCSCISSLPTTTFCETTCHTGCQTTTSIVRIPCATSVPSSSTTSSTSVSSSSSSSSSCTISTLSSSTSSSSSSSLESSTLTGSTSSSSSSSVSESSSSISGSITTSSTTSPIYTNSTVTVTSITTLTTCPYNDRCHGQTTTWSGTKGPFSCSATLTCTCVLPGGGSTTLTGPTTTISGAGQTTTRSGSGQTTTTEVTTVGQSTTSSVTSSAKSTSTALLQSSWGEKTIAEGWIGMIVVGLLGLL